MSENIQSIANGSFVLGNTSATTYQAGPGISITQPSEGTVRISNDETVLWETTGSTQVLTSATYNLSEPYTNFEYIGIWTRASFGTINGYHPAQTVKQNSTDTFIRVSIGDWGMGEAYDNNLYFDKCILTLNESTPNVVTASAPGKRLGINGDGAISFTNNRGTTIKKIVGINRISGNA